MKFLNFNKYSYKLQLHDSSRRCVFLGISEFVARDSNRLRFLILFIGIRRLISAVVNLFVFVGLTVCSSEKLAIVAEIVNIYKLVQIFTYILYIYIYKGVSF